MKIANIAKLQSHKINKKNNFISGWYMDDLSVCDDLIDLYDDSADKRPGTVGSLNAHIDTKVKDSSDVSINPRTNEPKIQNYLKTLLTMIDKYKKQYIYCNKFQRQWGINELLCIQKYKPKQGYHAYHYERSGTSTRMLAFLTYLNDVEDCGGTQFFYQKFKTKAEKGLTIIFPTEWTHTHRGIISPTETKYIIAGWFSYL